MQESQIQNCLLDPLSRIKFTYSEKAIKIWPNFQDSNDQFSKTLEDFSGPILAAFLENTNELYDPKVQLFWEGHKNLRNLP